MSNAATFEVITSLQPVAVPEGMQSKADIFSTAYGGPRGGSVTDCAGTSLPRRDP
ncbi:MAG: hypothetical protein M0R30_04970 [Methanoregula sp.]|uniref:hypothetical protein n=1 Tax=Methanoregula sp. TaxID=2052170 RepID=UPI0025EF54B5|nr:hypothetical protein [Methanoregula sp.]MCK9630974.1 hypothetical protein [Methanoregula sp.]